MQHLSPERPLVFLIPGLRFLNSKTQISSFCTIKDNTLMKKCLSHSKAVLCSFFLCKNELQGMERIIIRDTPSLSFNVIIVQELVRDLEEL